MNTMQMDISHSGIQYYTAADAAMDGIDWNRANAIIESTDLNGILKEIESDLSMKFGPENYENIKDEYRRIYEQGGDTSYLENEIWDSVEHISKGYNFNKQLDSINKSYNAGFYTNQYDYSMNDFNYNNMNNTRFKSPKQNNYSIDNNRNNQVNQKREIERKEQQYEQERNRAEEREKNDPGYKRTVDEIKISSDSKIIISHNDKTNEIFKQFVFAGKASNEIKISYEEYKSLKEMEEKKLQKDTSKTREKNQEYFLER